MHNCTALISKLNAGAFDKALSLLYPRADIHKARGRIKSAIKAFTEIYGERDIILISAPGRTEICGNHTDHQHGHVLAAAVDLDTLCIASPNADGVIRIKSEGHESEEIKLCNLNPLDSERGRGASIIRGVAAYFQENGHTIGGFDAYTTSNVLIGSGLSSSAAFEVAVGNILSHMYNGGNVSAVDIAIAGQFAENKYFGKPCGLMDQMASSLGGIHMINFNNPQMPEITPVACDITANGIKLCITDTGGSHADLTPEYAAIPDEMKSIARYYGKAVLHEVDETIFFAGISKLRDIAGDRAVLRAIHYYSDNARVKRMSAALDNGDISMFLTLVRESGLSSLACLQNVFVPGEIKRQSIPLALALSEHILGNSGAWRVHGGGFAGTIQAFVPDNLLEIYRDTIDGVFGKGSCKVLNIRTAGGTRITL